MIFFHKHNCLAPFWSPCVEKACVPLPVIWEVQVLTKNWQAVHSWIAGNLYSVTTGSCCYHVPFNTWMQSVCSFCVRAKKRGQLEESINWENASVLDRWRFLSLRLKVRNNVKNSVIKRSFSLKKISWIPSLC